jgi:ParB family chromosome partitioning protein
MMLQTEEATPEGEVPAAAEPAGEFVNVAIDMIATGPQVRTDIDPVGESIRALAESIRERGIIQPLTVCRSGDGYFLVVGERRLAAARLAGLAMVPVLVIPTIQRQEDALTLQLIENLQREDINPIDLAGGICAFFQSRHGEVPLQELSSVLQTYERDRERVPGDVAVTLTAIVNITGKSISSIRRSVALLALPAELRETLKSGQLGVTQGYLFTDYSDNPELLQIFHNLLAEPVTNVKLKSQLEAYARRAKRVTPKRYSPFLGVQASIRSAGEKLASEATVVNRDDLTALIAALRAIAAQAEARLAALPPEETPPADAPADPADAAAAD